MCARADDGIVPSQTPEAIRAFVGALPGRVYQILYPASRGRTLGLHRVDVTFMRAWLQHPEFHMDRLTRHSPRAVEIACRPSSYSAIAYRLAGACHAPPGRGPGAQDGGRHDHPAGGGAGAARPVRAVGDSRLPVARFWIDTGRVAQVVLWQKERVRLEGRRR